MCKNIPKYKNRRSLLTQQKRIIITSSKSKNGIFLEKIKGDEFMKHFAIGIVTLVLSLVVFFILGAFGLTDYNDGLIMSIGLIIIILLSIIISLLVKIDQKLK